MKTLSAQRKIYLIRKLLMRYEGANAAYGFVRWSDGLHAWRAACLPTTKHEGLPVQERRALPDVLNRDNRLF